MMNIRNATKEDAGALAYLINLAGEGIPEYFWKTMAAEGESPLVVGAGNWVLSKSVHCRSSCMRAACMAVNGY